MSKQMCVQCNFVILQAKAKYEREQHRKEQARLRGEGTWMLPAVSDRLQQDHKVTTDSTHFVHDQIS